MERPETRYAKTSEGVYIAYQVLGDGPIDLLYLPGYTSNLFWQWELPSYARFLEQLASFSRLILVDRRGTGLSDRFSPQDLPPLEDLADDLVTVMDAVGSERIVLLGTEDGCFVCSMFAATHPDRADAVVLYGMDPGSPDVGLAQPSPERVPFLEELYRHVDEHWGTRAYARWDMKVSHPSLAEDDIFLAWYEVFLQLAASPTSAKEMLRIWHEIDPWPVFATIRVPTLVLHRTGDILEPIEHARAAAARIPGARFVELPGDKHNLFEGAEDVAEEVEEFLTGSRHSAEPDRVLATVLFTDIVGSTERASRLGDRGWRELLDQHNARIRRQLERFRGREIDTTGDGFFATFDGPARAVRCAQAIGASVRELGMEIRTGCHTGEIELAAGDVRGIAVHIGARVSALAGPSEILVSSTVKDLVAGSGLSFEDAGEHELKGVPDRWRLYRVVT
ncbi:MAG: adenylate/guanylate cyclase domain-containing protein [Actinobacteria bacterium]|nr:MAG: adenylate/guanylate cyclase domain-containing protein [Actinomycetota bacterium]